MPNPFKTIREELAKKNDGELNRLFALVIAKLAMLKYDNDQYTYYFHEAIKAMIEDEMLIRKIRSEFK